MPEKQLKTIQRIAEKNYYKNTQSLFLYEQTKYWSDILLMRDWSMLQSICLGYCGINDDSIKVVLSLNWPNLGHLSIGDNQLTVKGIRQFVNKQWPKLHSIQLSNYESDGNNIKSEGFLMILQKFQKQATLLRLVKCGITCDGMQLMIDYSLKNLHCLSLGDNEIGSPGVKFLIKTDIPNLKQLKITNCKVGMQGMKHLTKANWPNLHTIQFAQWQQNGKNILNKEEFSRLVNDYLEQFQEGQIS